MKTLVATTSLLCMCSGALAQSSIVYGKIDVSANYMRFDGSASSSNLSAIASDSSLIGFRGSEDLGGGWRSYFKMEHGFQLDTGAQTSAPFWSREAYAGIEIGKLGSVQLGSQFAPHVGASARVDIFNRAGLGGLVSLLQGTRGIPLIYNNAVQYLSPNLRGLTARVLLSAGEGVAVPGRSGAAMLEYSAGPATGILIYNQIKTAAVSVGLSGDPVTNRTYVAAGIYDFKVMKLQGWYQSNRIDGVPNVNGLAVGASVPVGQGDVRASYVKRTGANADAIQMAVGYQHYLSKRTTLFTQVGRLENSGNAAFGIGPARFEANAAGLLTAGRDINGLQLGMRHTF